MFNIYEQLKKATPYMLCNDGKLLSCGDMHPYIKYIYEDTDKNQLIDLFTSRYYHLLWFYDNTNKDIVRKDIIDLVSAIITTNPFNFNESILNKLKSDFVDIKQSFASKFDIISAFSELNNETNQEFCRVRTSNIKYGGNDNSIYFRISSIYFNWFDLIWDLVYNNRHVIDNVTICKDQQTFGGRLQYYRHGNNILNAINTNKFLTLSGNPVIESNKKDKEYFKSLGMGLTIEETFGTVHPKHNCNCYNLIKDNYLKLYFE